MVPPEPAAHHFMTTLMAMGRGRPVIINPGGHFGSVCGSRLASGSVSDSGSGLFYGLPFCLGLRRRPGPRLLAP